MTCKLIPSAFSYSRYGGEIRAVRENPGAQRLFQRERNDFDSKNDEVKDVY